MPDPFPNARYRQTRLFVKAAADYNISFPEVRQVIRSYETRSPGSGTNQWWYFGSIPNGREVKVLVSVDSDDEVALITIIVVR